MIFSGVKPDAELCFAGHLCGDRKYARRSRPDSSSDQLIFWMMQKAVGESLIILEALGITVVARSRTRTGSTELSSQAAGSYV